MNIRMLAEQDLAVTLEDANAFGWPVTLTDPDGFTGSSNLTAQASDIGQMIDPDTGVPVSGRQAAAVLRISSVFAAGFILPVGIADSAGKPWLITFDDINGTEYTFKIEASDPDRTLGTVSLMLGVWDD